MATQTGSAVWNSRIDNLASNIKTVVETIASRADALKSAQKEASVRASSFAAKIGGYIKDHPFAALGTAFGLGMMFVMVAGRVARDLARFEPN